MKRSELRNLLREELEHYTKGLHQAKVGDRLGIGYSGNRNKWPGVVDSISNDGKVRTKDGDIFNKDGTLFRGKNPRFQKSKNPERRVSAQIVTQTKNDESFKKIKVDFIKKFDYNRIDIDDIMKIIDAFPNYTQYNKLEKSRFK